MNAFQPPQQISMDNAPEVLNAGLAAIAAGARCVDFSKVERVDSSAVALCLAWQRAAVASGFALQWVGITQSLQALAQVYEVAPILGITGVPSIPTTHH